jgi:hypothetical protein
MHLGPSSTRYLVDHSPSQHQHLGAEEGYLYGGAYVDEPYATPHATTRNSRPSGSSSSSKNKKHKHGNMNGVSSLEVELHELRQRSPDFSGIDTSSTTAATANHHSGGGGGLFSIFALNASSNTDAPASASPVVPTPTDSEAEDSDWSLARALQAMEFDIAGDTVGRHLGDEDFDEKEYRASSCKRQMLTLSTAICLIQVGRHI